MTDASSVGWESEDQVERESGGESESHEGLGRDEGGGEEGNKGGQGRDLGGGDGGGWGGGDGGGDIVDVEGRGRDRNLRPIVGISQLIKMSFFLIIQTTPSTISLTNGGQSFFKKVLLVCVVISDLVGYICVMASVLLIHSKPRVASILGGIGITPVALGFILFIVAIVLRSLVWTVSFAS